MVVLVAERVHVHLHPPAVDLKFEICGLHSKMKFVWETMCLVDELPIEPDDRVVPVPQHYEVLAQAQAVHAQLFVAVQGLEILYLMWENGFCLSHFFRRPVELSGEEDLPQPASQRRRPLQGGKLECLGAKILFEIKNYFSYFCG